MNVRSGNLPPAGDLPPAGESDLSAELNFLGEVQELEAGVDLARHADSQAVRRILEPASASFDWSRLMTRAAAVTVLGVFLGLGWQSFGTHDTPESTAEALEITHLPSSEMTEGRFDLFDVAASKDCAFVIILRGWDDDCTCVRYREDPGDELQIRRGTVKAGENFLVELDVTGDPAVEQLLIVLSAPTSDQLPWTTEAANNLVRCLDLADPATCAAVGDFPAGVTDHLASVPHCLAADVEVHSTRFVVEP